MHAIPGEEDYESIPRPNSRFDCEPLKALYNDLNLKTVRECMQNSNQTTSLKNPNEIIFQLHRDTAPYLSLVEPSDTELENPECYRKVLSKIPVPREIFFQSQDNGHLNCYNSRIPIIPEEFLGIKGFLYKYQVKVPFPLQHLPKTDEETVFLLATWSIQPFFDHDQQTIASRVVPSPLCRSCMGLEKMFRETDLLPPFWPKLGD